MTALEMEKELIIFYSRWRPIANWLRQRGNTEKQIVEAMLRGWKQWIEKP